MEVLQTHTSEPGFDSRPMHFFYLPILALLWLMCHVWTTLCPKMDISVQLLLDITAPSKCGYVPHLDISISHMGKLYSQLRRLFPWSVKASPTIIFSLISSVSSLPSPVHLTYLSQWLMEDPLGPRMQWDTPLEALEPMLVGNDHRKHNPQFEKMAYWWSARADGKAVFYKMPEHLSTYYTKFSERRQTKQTMIESQPQCQPECNQIRTQSHSHHAKVLPCN